MTVENNNADVGIRSSFPASRADTPGIRNHLLTVRKRESNITLLNGVVPALSDLRICESEEELCAQQFEAY